MKRILPLICILLISFELLAQDKTTVIDVNILPYKSLTNGAFFKSLVLKSDEAPLEYVSGFDFEWGYNYKLRVKKTELAQPMQDASSVEYALVKVLSKTKASAKDTFQLLLSAEKYLGGGEEEDFVMMKALNDSTYIYDDEITFVVPSELKERFQKVFKPNSYVFGKFVFGEGAKIRLVGFR